MISSDNMFWEYAGKNKKRTNRKKSGLPSLVGLLGFEPRKTESKSVVLPLHHNPILIWSAKIRFQPFSAKWFLVYLLKNVEKKLCDKDIAHYIDGIVGAPVESF